MMQTYAPWFAAEHAWAMPVVAETYDGILNDINALHVKPAHAKTAIAAAKGGAVEEGSVGGGNGMIAYEFKAGTGTASRQVDLGGQSFTLGVLVQANHGRREWFTILGKPVGAMMPEGSFRKKEQGSIIVVIATDAPLSPLSLRHLARRAAMGVARGGTPAGNSSGDIFLAFSTANPGPMPQDAGPLVTRVELNQEIIDPLYLATAEATEEAVINAIVAGEEVVAVKPKGLTVPGINREKLASLFAKQT
jgi:D-aminopeptidase